MLKKIKIENYPGMGDFEINLEAENKIASKTKTLAGKHFHLTYSLFSDSDKEGQKVINLFMNILKICFGNTSSQHFEKLFTEFPTIFEIEYSVNDVEYTYVVEVINTGYVSRYVYKNNMMIDANYTNDETAEIINTTSILKDQLLTLEFSTFNYNSILNTYIPLLRTNLSFKNVYEELLRRTNLCGSLKLLNNSFEILYLGSYVNINEIRDSVLKRKLALSAMIAEKILTQIDNTTFIIFDSIEGDTYFFNQIIKMLNSKTTAQFLLINKSYYNIPEIIKTEKTKLA